MGKFSHVILALFLMLFHYFHHKKPQVEKPFAPTKEWLQEIHTKVKDYKAPSYRGAQIRVPSGLHIQAWRALTIEYEFKILTEYIEFGFPMKVKHDKFKCNINIVNNKSSLARPKGVQKYSETEVKKHAMVGTLQSSPFSKIHFSPLLARDKPEGGVIVGLSWPLGQAINSCINSNYHDNIEFTLKYPTIDYLVHQISQLSPETLKFKVDLERAFRNLRIDPYDYPMLGLKWDSGIYIDIGVPFGFSTAAASCHLCTDLVTHTLRKRHIWTMNYLDDFTGTSLLVHANSHFLPLKNILEELGLPINKAKSEPPSESITCLGIHVNARTDILAIPSEKKMLKIKQLCRKWTCKTHATRNKLQKLTGKLLYIHRCVKPARLLLNRILATLRKTPLSGHIQLPTDFYKDIN